MLKLVWLIPVLPLAAWLVTFLASWLKKARWSWPGIAAVGTALFLSLLALKEVAAGGNYHEAWTWLAMGDGITLKMGLTVDPLSAVMLVVVTTVSLMVQIYSRGYMHGDDYYARYYANVSLFTFAMLLLVLADNFLLMLVAWELMGLCSYLLIGHWFEKDDARAASIKAFLTTRVGDLGLILAAVLIFQTVGSFGFNEVFTAARTGAIPAITLAVIAFGLLAGAVGKSAQFPLHVWLPDAMAGPTPASALIHAATMVAAGVYLMARSYPLLELSRPVMTAMAFIGGFTALFAATIAVVMTDIKKVLAYSTISQLGYMMLALGVGGLTAGVFHLVTHAFFKALLFLAAGSVIHAIHTQEMHQMGGLARKMPVTTLAFGVGAAALAGVPPFSGFWSKDEILAAAAAGPYPVLYWTGLVTAALTAFYITRVVVLTFGGTARTEEARHGHESPAVMTGPLLVLTVLAALTGLAGSPWLGNPWQRFLGVANHAVAGTEGVTLWATGMALSGIFLGLLTYVWPVIPRARLIAAGRPVYQLLKNKYYIDEFYRVAVINPVMALAKVCGQFDREVIDRLVNAVGAAGVLLSRWTGMVDTRVVDGAVNGVAKVTAQAGQGVRRLQTGYAATYLLTFVLGVVGALVIYQIVL